MAKTIGQLTQTTTIAGGDEFVIEQSGQTKRVAASVVRGGLVNADIDAAAAIAFSKLAALDSANILVGNGSNVATKVAVTGDVTISNAGVTALARPYTLATAQASTSGTSIDFTGIPSWVKRITVIFNGVSSSGASQHLIRLGTSTGFVTSGYASYWGYSHATAQDSTNSTAGLGVWHNNAADVKYATAVLSLVSGNTWVASHFGGVAGSGGSNLLISGGGSIALSGTLTQVRITTVNGTDTFDAGSINISYEG